MSVRVTCSCGKTLRLSEDEEQGVDCPRCGEVVNLPPEETPRSRPARRKRGGDEERDDNSRGPDRSHGEGGDASPAGSRREPTGGRRYLRGVNRGLALHYAAPSSSSPARPSECWPRIWPSALG